MSEIGGVPPSIREALSSKTGFVLVVTGKPGTGKSLLVQEIFRTFENSFMIITSTENHMATVMSLSDAVPDWGDRHVLTQYWRPLVEKTSHESSLETQLSRLVGASEDQGSADVVIIDSWTDFVEPINPANRYEIQQSLIHAARNEGRKLVLVTEGEWDSTMNNTLHHSADGVVTLEKIRENQRMFRQIVLEKMRAQLISQDSFLFTLHKGRFTYIPWYVHQYPAITVGRDPIPDPSPERMSTGNLSLDSVLGGGFLKGQLSLIEVDNLGVPYLETIYIPFLSNHLELGRPAVILLPEGWSPEFFTESLTHFVDKNRIDNQVVFFGRHAPGQYANVRGLDADSRKTLQEIRYESSELERKYDHEVTELFSLDTLENMYGPAQVRGMIAELSASLPRAKRTTLTILSRQQEVKSESISHHVHLRVQEICGVMGVSGETPRTNFLAVRPLLSGGFLDYKLMPIV
ncbi:MAG: ATPase domain-containing protein [Candidatus Thorarchaeota archaeon]|jgi:KaiC/GvpD/RAD55 family RecA-like ATPase